MRVRGNIGTEETMRKENAAAVRIIQYLLRDAGDKLTAVAQQETAAGAPGKITHTLNIAHDYISEGAKAVEIVLRQI